MSIAWEAAGASDVGRRRRDNEDAFRIHSEHGVFLVADGMGGHAAGEVASDLVAATVAARLAGAREAGVAGEGWAVVLHEAGPAAHAAIHQCCTDNPATRGMGTTLTACVLEPSGECWIGHIGDSRLYRLREGKLEQVTHDHTWVQREVDTGRLAPEAAPKHPLSHILTRVLSDDSDPQLDVLPTTVRPGDLLLLATDGLYNMLNDDAIAALISADLPLPHLARALIDAGNRAGGTDNITVVLVRVV